MCEVRYRLLHAADRDWDWPVLQRDHRLDHLLPDTSPTQHPQWQPSLDIMWKQAGDYIPDIR